MTSIARQYPPLTTRRLACLCVWLAPDATIRCHSRPLRFVRLLRLLRRQGLVAEFVSVYLHDVQRAVYIATDGGRVSLGAFPIDALSDTPTLSLPVTPAKSESNTFSLTPGSVGLARWLLRMGDGWRQVCRPLLVCEKGRPRLTEMAMRQLSAGLIKLSELIRHGVIEYVDVNEENNCLISLSQDKLTSKHTHVEIDPLTILGVVAGQSSCPLSGPLLDETHPHTLRPH